MMVMMMIMMSRDSFETELNGGGGGGGANCLPGLINLFVLKSRVVRHKFWLEYMQ